MDRIKYISNKDLLQEIHRSKITYSSFTDKSYHRFDAIIRSLDELTPEFIEQTFERQTSSLTKRGNTTELPDTFAPADLIFRLMTDRHVPLETCAKRLKRGFPTIRTSFPPFEHYVIRDGIAVEVGRSHWIGTLEAGRFCDEHGTINNRLASMFMLLVDRFSRRSNWRSYCVDGETKALTQRGWLGTDDITERDIILSYDNGQLKWSKIESIFRDDDYKGKMFKLSVTGMDALVTPRHKFVTDGGLKEVDYLLATDRIILTGAPLENGPGFVDDKIKVIPELIDFPVVLSLTQHQRQLLIGAIFTFTNRYKHSNKEHIDAVLMLCTIAGYRVSIKKTDTYFEINRLSAQEKSIKVEKIDFAGGKRNGDFDHPNEPTTDYHAKVWCPKTEYGSFMAMRNGTIYLTGNTYVDEMRSFSLLQLSKVGLQFDESKSDNPFAFYTQIIKNCFRRVLNIEHRNRDIRDDLLIMAGAAPSFTRQIDHELEQMFEQRILDGGDDDGLPKVEPVLLPKKRGRKPKV